MMAAKMLVVLAMAFLVNVASGSHIHICGYPANVNCFRNTLHDNGGACYSNTWKTNVDPILVSVPRCGVTLEKRNCVFEGIDQTYIRDLFADYDNDVIVLWLLHPKVRVRCDMDIYFHQLGDRNLMVPTRCDATYINYSTTTLFPLKCGSDVIDIENRQTYPGMTTYTATFGSPALTAAVQTIPRVAQGVQCIKSNLDTVMKEIQWQKAKAFSRFYINNRLVEVDNELPCPQLPII